MSQPSMRLLAARVVAAASWTLFAVAAHAQARAGAAPVSKPAPLPAAVMSAGKAIEPAKLEGHVRFLADDALEGRGTGTRGYDKAAQYVAEQMQ